MKARQHIYLVSKTPSVAQISSLQIKLESTSEIIDRLLLVPRQQPWKATGPSGEDTDTDTDTNTDTNTEL